MAHQDLGARYVPVIPDKFRIYDSYTVDPQWQIKFTIIWTSILAFITVVSIPYIYKTVRSGRYYSSLAIRESSEGSAKALKRTENQTSGSSDHLGRRIVRRGDAIWQTIALWSIPFPRLSFWKKKPDSIRRWTYLSLSLGQIILVLAYIAASLACILVGAELLQNANRPGFIALSQLPLILLLSLKSPLPLPIFLPTLSYEHYNFLHRWSGRTLFILVTVHGGMWLNQFIATNQMDQVWSEKSKRGMIAYGLMCGIVITSLKPIRRVCYQVFWISHLCLFTGFFAAISYHTPYSRPWIYPCFAIYGYDFVVRMLRYRMKKAILLPVDGNLIMIHIPHCDSGWKPTQHVFLRVLKGPGIFESHPYTITNAPSSSGQSRGIILYAKVSGDWTRRLYAMSKDVATLEVGEDVEEREAFLEKMKEYQGEGSRARVDHPGKQVTVISDGPYGGLKMDLAEYDSVLCFAGGSGITFALGTIEEAIRVREAGRRPSRVQVIWAVKEISTVEALSSTLSYLHARAKKIRIDLRYDIYLTRQTSSLPDISAILPITTTLSSGRPEISQLVRSTSLSSRPSRDTETGQQDLLEGLAVIACGPEGIIAEAGNAVASLSIKERVKCRGIRFHGECYAL